jgi:hypothetical protein
VVDSAEPICSARASLCRAVVPCPAPSIGLRVAVPALLALVACGPGAGDATGQNLSAAGTPLPLSWGEPSWFVDPANVTGAAADTNTCTTNAQPCLSYQGIAAKWGTYSPRLRQNTSITFLSSHADDTDPVYFSPLIEHGAFVSIQGVLGPAQQVAAGTLSNVVPKNRSTGRLLTATLPAGAAPGQLVVNTTHPGRAWVYRSAAGASWFLSQPYVPTPLGASFDRGENDGWTDGDSITLFRPVDVNLAEVAPVLVDPIGLGDNLNIYQLTAFTPPGEAISQLTITSSINVFFLESSIQRVLDYMPSDTSVSTEILNCDMEAPVAVSETEPIAHLIFVGGQLRPPNFADLRGPALAGDIVLGGPSFVEGGGYVSVFLDTGSTLSVTSATFFPGDATPDIAPTMFWGPGAVDVFGNARLEYFTGAGEAQTTFLQTGGLTIDGANTACAVDTAAGGSFRCGIPITPANLDAPVSAGGFGGNAVNPGGGAISNIEAP